MVLVTGWGNTMVDGVKNPIDLQAAELHVMDRKSCQGQWGPKAIDASNICAVSSDKSGCNGDSGGPLTINGKLVGVVSFGVRFCQPGSMPNSFAYVPGVKRWINQTIKNN
ncbi:unnamed protein product [Oppiella nova]|uniref:Peptidase S1 domain-containing protein n=1 Tax=Oppiella nova TaxID=334625 RepID=A0A7R9MU36_9ACAR|nr:unnamed protein product [Oppiella nova]CAG2183381.1 unnamed protein product [Oppiella nova]